jgi:hypothetical protein
MYRVGIPGTVTVSIRATSGGLPVGGDLCSGTINGNTLTTDPAGAVYEISLGDGAVLEAGVQYAIVVRAPSGTLGNDVVIQFSGDTYPRGTYVQSSNSGSSWAINSSYDLYFEDWGFLVAHVLTVNSNLQGIPFTINDVQASTPYSAELEEGGYTITMPTEGDVAGKRYRFKMWMEDGSPDPVKTINLTADTSLTAIYEEVAHALTVDANIQVSFTINGASKTTPYTEVLQEGTYTVSMPSTVEGYRFKSWEDGSTDPTRTVNLTSDLAIFATYEAVAPPVGFTLTVDSEPQGVPFTINNVQAVTPYSVKLETGDYTVTMPEEWNGYRFKQWEDGSTNPVRSITLTADTSMKATYERVAPAPAAPAVPWHIVVPAALGVLALVGVGVWYYTRRKASKGI